MVECLPSMREAGRGGEEREDGEEQTLRTKKCSCPRSPG